MNTKLYYLKGGELGTPEWQAAFNELVGIAARGEHVVVQCGSVTGLAKGDLVCPVGIFTGHTDYGTGLLVDKADASDPDKAAWGVMSEAIAAFTGFGVAYRTGIISGIDTHNAAMVGDIAYLSPDNPGAFTFTKPTTAGHIVQPVGVAVTDAASGSMYFSCGTFYVIGDVPAGAVVADEFVGSQAGLRVGNVQLNGVNPTRVLFQGSDAATILGTDDAATKALANGSTLVVNPDGAGDDTVTFAAAPGTSVSGANAPEDIHTETDTKFKISVDGDAAEEVTIDLAACTSGVNTAAEMQTKIRALGGAKAAVTVGFAATKYTITSGTAGTGSAVVVTNAPAGNIAEELKIGATNGGTETAGTGDAANIGAATAAEVAAAIAARATGWTATAEGNKVRITSETIGKDSSLVVNAASTADTVLGITGSAHGAQGLGYTTDLGQFYWVALTLKDSEKGNVTALSVNNRIASGFDIVAGVDACAEEVDVIVIGFAA